MRAWRHALIAAVLTLGMAACTATRQAATTPREVRIGLLAPLSGADSQLGRDAQRGAQLAADLVNDASAQPPIPLGTAAGLPGLGGAKLHIVAADTADDPQRAVSQAARLVRAQHVAGLTSAGAAQATAAASERTERLGVPFVNGDASAGYLTERAMDWFFRVGPTDRMLGATLLSMLGRAKQPTVRRLGVINVDDEGGGDIGGTLEALAAEGGDRIAATAIVQPGATNATAAFQQLGAGGSDTVIAAAAGPADAATLLKNVHADGHQPATLIGMGAGFTPAVIQAASTADMLRVTGWSAELAGRSPTASQVSVRYQRQYHAAMTEPAADAFTAVLTLAQAVDAAHSISAQQVRAALLGLDVRGRDTIMPWGGIRFDESGQNVLAAGVVEQLRQGKLRVVFPRDLAAPAN